MNKYGWILAAGTAAIVCGLPYKIDVTHNTVVSTKIKAPVKIAVISDLHCRSFGRGQSKILSILKKERPDIIVIPGDLFDVGRNLENSFDLIRRIKNTPIYYTSGNHDIYLKDQISELRLRLKAEGVHVLDDAGEIVQAGNGQIEIYGMCDHGRKAKYSAADISERFQTDDYRILISHRQSYTDFYSRVDCDLILSGHAHGGQWRIPMTHQGLFAPQMGILPKYTEGIHDLNGRKLIISRGLASGNPMIPRLYNNPEIVMIDLEPAN